MAFIADRADRATLRQTRVFEGCAMARTRIILSDDEDEYFRRDPIGFLRHLEIEMPMEDGEEFEIVEVRSAPSRALQAAGDCDSVKCYDLYCWPPSLIVLSA